LPNLRELHCHDCQDHLLEVISYLSPTLEVFQLDNQQRYREPSRSAKALLSALATKSPLIKDLCVTGYPASTAPTFLEFPQGLIHLSTFECSNIPISHDAVWQLAYLPNLINLSFYFLDDHASELSKLVTPTAPFSSLRELTLNGAHFVSGIPFIRTYLKSAPLEFIGVGASQGSSAGEIHALLSTLWLHLQFQALTRVHLFNHTFPSTGVGSPLMSTDLMPLLEFKNLEALRVVVASSVAHLDNSLLDAMSLAWPRLTHLHIEPWDANPSPSQCSFQGILLLAKRCPNLRSLAIPFLASEPISWKRRPGEGVVHECMEELDVLRSPIVDPDMVASFLSDVFPNLDSFDSWQYMEDHDDAGDVRFGKLWQKAIRLYGRYSEIRKEERAWATYYQELARGAE
jgi:hypothetical protein